MEAFFAKLCCMACSQPNDGTTEVKINMKVQSKCCNRTVHYNKKITIYVAGKRDTDRIIEILNRTMDDVSQASSDTKM